MSESNQNKLRTPVKSPRLQRGDTLAVISPAGATPDPDEAFAKGVQLLEEEGFRVKVMPSAKRKNVYLAGEDTERLADLRDAFLDPEIKGILCARGGYGSMRLLPHINFDWVRQNPKIFIGFSDITALLLPFYQETGLVGFYGPMLTSNLIHGEPFSQKALFPLVCGETPVPTPIENRDAYRCFQAGIVEAPLIGGNLSLLSALCGTPYQPKTRGHLLFIEDWKEKYYSLDRQFQQLKLAGVLDGIAGLLLCDFSDIEPEPEFDVAEQLRRLTADLGVPVGYGFSVGHGEQTATLPIGVRARWNAETGELMLLESAVAI